jgi:hypothetical protein
MTRRTCLSAAAALTFFAGCEQLDPAPEDLDGLFHYFWSLHDDGVHEELASGVANADLALAGVDLAEEIDGTLSDLDGDEAALVGMAGDVDPTEAQGLYLVDLLPCTLDQVESITLDEDLGALFADEYALIEREVTSDLASYLDRTTDRATWTTLYEDDLGGADYERSHEGGIRRVPDLGEGLSPLGEALLTREWLLSPADFGGGETFWDQDYQVDVYYERAEGEVVHLMGLWRLVGMGEITSENEFMQTMILRSRSNWDERMAEICVAGSTD